MPSPSSSTSTAPVATPEKVLSTLPSVTHPPRTTPTILADTEQRWLFTETELARTPSIRAGMDPNQEHQLRAKGLSFISQTGIMLKLPQIALQTASIFFNRFLMRYSLIHDKRLPSTKGRRRPLHVYQIGALALHLSTKVSETPRKLRDIIVSCVRVALHNSNLLVPEDSKDFWRWRDTLLLNEDLMLELLCFDLHVDSPHRILFDLLRSLGAENKKRLRDAAWAFVNDAGATTLGLRFSARIIAASAIYAAAKHCEYLGDTDGVRFKDDARSGKPWWAAHGMELRDIRRCCNAMADLYEAEPVHHGGTPGREQLMGDGGDALSPQEAEESLYKRMRTPSQGPEEEAPTRAMRKIEGSIKRDRDGTPKAEPHDTSQLQSQPQPPPSQTANLQEPTAPASEPSTKRRRTGEHTGLGTATDAAAQRVVDEHHAPPAKDEEGSEEGEVEG